MAGSARFFETGRLNVYESLLAKATDGNSGLPLTSGLVLLIRHCSALRVILVVIVGLTSLMSGTAFSPRYMFTEEALLQHSRLAGPYRKAIRLFL